MNIRSKFEDQGFVVLEGIIDQRELEQIKAAAANIVDSFDIDQHRTVFSTKDNDKGRDRYFMDSAEAIHCFLEEEALDESGNLSCPKSQAINKIGHALHDLQPEFTRFCRLPVFGEVLETLGFEKPQLWQTMYIFKQPKIGGEVRWHQDASYLRSLNSPVVGMWVAVEDATLENGCLWVEPGGHKSPLRELYEVDPETRKGELMTVDNTPWPSESSGFPVELKAGGVIVFSDRMPHYSSANRSERSRQAFTMHLSDHDAGWSPLNWLQRPNLPPFYLKDRAS